MESQCGKVNDLNPTQRFSNRVADYVGNRPSYPVELIDFLASQHGRFHDTRVADFGAGTGIFSRLLLERGAAVDAVEPNAEMREASCKDLGAHRGFRSFAGTAEASGLPPHSIDLITCAQAFHWFDPIATRKEFDRVLKPNGRIALIWNEQKKEAGVSAAYDKAKVEFGGENRKAVERVTAQLDVVLPAFFAARGFESHTFANFQDLDRNGLIGRFFSASYAPAPGSPRREPASRRLSQLFDEFNKNGFVRLNYTTELFYGS